MKWFHVTRKGGSSRRDVSGVNGFFDDADLDKNMESIGRSSKSSTQPGVYYPMTLQVSHRRYRNIEYDNTTGTTYTTKTSYRFQNLYICEYLCLSLRN